MKKENLPLIPHEIDNGLISQRAYDGYINATDLCKTAGKKFNDYKRIQVTKAFVNELSAVMGIPATDLIQIIQGGIPELQGSWVHPQVAINLGQWVDN